MKALEPLTVVCWKWRSKPGYRSMFTSHHVNVLRSMVERNYRRPHEFVCVTDDAAGLDERVRHVKLWSDHAGLRNPHGDLQPSCYRRLKAFSKDAGRLFGPRFVSIDLDCVVTGDLAPLWDRPEDFVIWGDTNPNTPYNGSMWMLRAGTRARVWDEFDPKFSPRYARSLGYFGSDQAWIGACLGKREAMWTTADGVYSFRNHIFPHRTFKTKPALPDGCRIVLFHGRLDPWSPGLSRRFPWIAEHWR